MTSTGNCADCGAVDQAGPFCDRCGAVLSWTRPSGPGQPAPADPADLSDASTGPLPPVGGAGPDASTDPLGAGASDMPSVSEPHRTPTEDERARRLVVPVPIEDRDVTVPAGPEPVLPGRPEAARPHVRAASPDWSGGVPCPWCGTPNPPDRHFCRQCAMRLDAAANSGYRTQTWWRRLFGGGRDREPPWAGERPKLRRGLGRLLAVVVSLLIAVPLIWLAATHADDVANGVVDHFAKRVPLQPTGWSASHSDPKHGPGMAFDERSNTYWGSGYGGDSAGVHLDATFTQPSRLLDIIITSGVSTEPDQYATQARPEILDATVFFWNGSSKTTTLKLNDAPGPQKVKLRGNDVRQVRLTIRSAYGTARNRQVCIAEVEFFTRSTTQSL